MLRFSRSFYSHRLVDVAEDEERENSGRPVDWQSEDFMMTFHASCLFFILYIFYVWIFFGIISIMFVIGCIRLEGGVLDSYYISCNARSGRPSPPGKQAHNTHHQSSTVDKSTGIPPPI